jgi:4-hydroxyphenylpyruvate dioxygenase
MNFHHIHFYVDDAIAWRQWFHHRFAMHWIQSIQGDRTQTEVLQTAHIRIVLSSPRHPDSPVFSYLTHHPPGVADVAFQVSQIDVVVQQASLNAAVMLQPIQAHASTQQRWAILQGWGDLTHTLLDSEAQSGAKTPLSHNEPTWDFLPLFNTRFQEQGQITYSSSRQTQPIPAQAIAPKQDCPSQPSGQLTHIDHAVLNVEFGDLSRAIAWYESVLGFQRQQQFLIQTPTSGLTSQVLIHPEGNAQFPINEPTSNNSQIQEFLDIHRGAGIQHIAFHSHQIVQTVATLRQRGLTFLPVPTNYYDQLKYRHSIEKTTVDWEAIAQQQVLVDWDEENSPAMLLQIFTTPIFRQPTFFFEIIERQSYCEKSQCLKAQGFGEGNFRALFEAIEQEQIKRGNLIRES